jgi:hypothetical protein
MLLDAREPAAAAFAARQVRVEREVALGLAGRNGDEPFALVRARSFVRGVHGLREEGLGGECLRGVCEVIVCEVVVCEVSAK